MAAWQHPATFSRYSASYDTGHVLSFYVWNTKFSCHAAIFLDKSRVPEWQLVAAVAGDRRNGSVRKGHDFPNMGYLRQMRYDTTHATSMTQKLCRIHHVATAPNKAEIRLTRRPWGGGEEIP
jgi:hypothetical protein